MLITILAIAATLFLTGPIRGQSNFGSATAVVGNDVVIGQPANFYGPGAVYVFRSNAEGVWAEAARLYAPDSTLGDRFGLSLAGTGQRLLIGAPAREAVGAVHLLIRDANGTWSPSASVQDPTGEMGTRFGAAVVLANDLVFVGAPGSGRVYQLSTRNGRLEVSAVLQSSLTDDSRFGAALGVLDDVLLVGAPGAGEDAGAVVVYRQDEEGSWTEEQVLSGPEVEDRIRPRFGTSVLLDAEQAFVGVPGGNGAAGAVTVFERRTTTWQDIGELRPQGDAGGSGFGAALASTGDEVWVGAPGAGGDGAVYRFRRSADTGWAAFAQLRPDSADTAAWRFGFGGSFAVGSTVSVIGMPTRDFGEGRAAIMMPSGDVEWDQRATVFGQIVPAVGGIEPYTDCDDGSIGGFPCSNVEVVSFTPVSELGGARGVWVNDVWGWTDPETGRDYALVSRRDGAAFVDLTDPTRPRLIGSLPRTPGARPTTWRDIKVVNHHAYVVSDGAGPHGMQVFDLTRLRSVTDPPVTFAADTLYDQIHSAHNVVADTASGFLYIAGANGGGETCGGGLHMVDARDPKRPVFAGCYNDVTGARARGYTHDAQCVVYRGPDTRYTGRQICVGSNESEINIADVTDKAQPVPIGRSSYPNVAYAHQGWLDESQRYFYMNDELDEIGGLVDGTRTLVWDLLELDDPILVKEYIGPVRASDHNLFIRGDLAYMSNYGSGLRVLDISDPENPHEVAFFDSAPVGDNEPGTSSSASGAWSNYPFFESGLVVFTSVREGLFVVRVKPPVLIP